MLRPTYLRLPELALLLAVVLGVLYVVSPLTGANLGGIVLVQIAAFALPPILIAHHVTGSPRRTAALLGLRRPGLRPMIGAALTGLSFWYLSLWIIVPISIELFGPEGLDELEQVFLRSELPIAVVVLVVGVAPAVCEEILYRGALTRSLQPRFGNIVAIVVPAVLFGLMHSQPIRILPATTLGVVLGIATLRSGGIVPSMLVHFLNNTIVLLLGMRVVPGIEPLVEAHPSMSGVAALTLCVMGIWLLWTSTPELPIRPRKSGSATSP